MRKKAILLSPYYYGHLNHYCRFQSILQSCCRLNFLMRTYLSHCGYCFHPLSACWHCCHLRYCCHSLFHSYHLSYPCTFDLSFCHRSLPLYSRRNGWHPRLYCQSQNLHAVHLCYLFYCHQKSWYLQDYDQRKMSCVSLVGYHHLSKSSYDGRGSWNFPKQLLMKIGAGYLHLSLMIYCHCLRGLIRPLKNHNCCRRLQSHHPFENCFYLSDEHYLKISNDLKMATIEKIISDDHLQKLQDRLVLTSTISKEGLKANVNSNGFLYQIMIYLERNYFDGEKCRHLQLSLMRYLQHYQASDQKMVQRMSFMSSGCFLQQDCFNYWMSCDFGCRKIFLHPTFRNLYHFYHYLDFSFFGYCCCFQFHLHLQYYWWYWQSIQRNPSGLQSLGRPFFH